MVMMIIQPKGALSEEQILDAEADLGRADLYYFSSDSVVKSSNLVLEAR
jgi:hypothetical protein